MVNVLSGLEKSKFGKPVYSLLNINLGEPTNYDWYSRRVSEIFELFHKIQDNVYLVLFLPTPTPFCKAKVFDWKGEYDCYRQNLFIAHPEMRKLFDT